MGDRLIIAGIYLGCVAIVIAMIWASMEEQREWDAFAKEHNCKVVEYMKGGLATGVGQTVSSSGNAGMTVIIVSEPDKVCYLCDDGKKYWR